jgi:hypothetical protein
MTIAINVREMTTVINNAVFFHRQPGIAQLKPSAIADAFRYVAHQDRSAGTHELDVRRFKEKF